MSIVTTNFKVVKGTEVPSGASCSATIQDTSSNGEIGVFRSGNTFYIAPNDEFDYSSVVYAPEDSSSLFRGKTFENYDFANLDTSKVTNMCWMFWGATAKSIDLSSFNTSKVTNMCWMFYQCSYLETIYAGSGFTTSQNPASDYMFTDSTKIKGGQGTTYNSSKVNASYAHIDGGTSNPGYFTAK